MVHSNTYITGTELNLFDFPCIIIDSCGVHCDNALVSGIGTAWSTQFGQQRCGCNDRLGWTADVKDRTCELCSHKQITASKFREGVKERKKKEVRNNKNSNYVLLDSVHRLYHGVLYFQNVIQFHGTG